ncbi:DedA family protein [Candidatus Woesearchaeota archaeon]|nr:DedA family protein [Candidatus Woesearchaeota archaeon]
MMAIFQNLIDETLRTFSYLGATGLFILAFIESSFFPIPPDLLLISLVLSEPHSWIWYALVCTIGSTLGGLFGYLIGYVGKIKVLQRFVKQEKIDQVHNYFHKYDAWAIFISAFTPIPYKVFTISAGVFNIELKRFTIASLIGRGLRFFLIAGLLGWKGKEILSFIKEYFGILTIITTIILITIYIVYIKIKKKL